MTYCIYTAFTRYYKRSTTKLENYVADACPVELKVWVLVCKVKCRRLGYTELPGEKVGRGSIAYSLVPGISVCPAWCMIVVCLVIVNQTPDEINMYCLKSTQKIICQVPVIRSCSEVTACWWLNPIPWSRVLLGKRKGSKLVKEPSTFFVTAMFIVAFTRARHLSIYWASLLHYMLQFHFFNTYFTRPHVSLVLHSGFFPSGFSSKTVYSPFSAIRATRTTHLSSMNLLTRIISGEEYRA
jgi:hypothetical protein